MNDTFESSVVPGQGNVVVVDHWYFHFWPWVLVLIPFSAVLFGILMVVMVASFPDDLVVDDYYKDGMAINQILTLDKNAKKVGVTAKLILSEGSPLRFQVENVNDSALLLNLFHVTDSELDTSMVLYPQSDGVYAAGSTTETDVSSLADNINKIFTTTGVWYVELNGADESWRLRARINTPVTTLLLEAK